MAEEKNETKIIEDKIRAGFTLVEMLVAMAIFLIVVGVAIGTLINAMKSQRNILSGQQMLDQTSYVLEYMSRALRMAKKDINGSCISINSNYEISISGIKFENYKGECQEFYLDAGRLKERKNGGVGVDLISGNLTINNFKVISSGKEQADSLQPAITFFLDVEGNEYAKMQVQATVSQRDLDILY